MTHTAAPAQQFPLIPLDPFDADLRSLHAVQRNARRDAALARAMRSQSQRRFIVITFGGLNTPNIHRRSDNLATAQATAAKVPSAQSAFVIDTADGVVV